MNEIKCPANLNDYSTSSIFLGGGITDCPDWQEEICRLLSNNDVNLVNPRRSDFDVTNPNMSKEQIRWEYEHLSKCDAIMFWFPMETLCPITLYELGFHAGKKKLFVGCHPDYKRKFDVTEQLRLVDSSIIVKDSLESLVEQIKNYLDLAAYDSKEHGYLKLNSYF
jgi:hypothetical protein